MTARTTKVLHLQLPPLLSGVQRVTLNEISALYTDYDYTLVCSKKGPLTKALLEYDVDCHCIPELTREITVKNDFKALFKLYKFIKKEKFDIVHTHSSKTGILGRVAAKLARVGKVIHTVHGFSFPAASSKKSYYLYFFMEWIAKFFTDKLIVLNVDDEYIAINKLKFKRDKVFLIPNGVDTDKFSPLENKIYSSTLNLVMVGRLSKQKDPETLLLAVEKLLNENVNVKLTLVGDGELKEQLESRFKRQDGRIIFHGWSDNIVNILKVNDLFILPSLWEGMPLAILEALSCGLPCIVTNIPGNNSLIEDGYNGCLFEIRDCQLLSQKIMSYVGKPELIAQQSTNARSFILKNYGLVKRNNKVRQLYDN
ncbi:TPA: glycosyltransferase family 4 protein [Escherichia coli]